MSKKIIVIFILIIAAIAGYFYWDLNNEKPEEVLNEYISKLNDGKYDEIYNLLDEESKQKISSEDFTKRNSKIYEGIDASNIQINIKEIQKVGSERKISYNEKMQASGGEITFDNEIKLVNENGYKIKWTSNLIFPDLGDDDKVRINTSVPKRGKILDRNGKELAGEGTASSIGIVPGKLSESKEEDIKKIAELLNISEETINKKLNASWVNNESFVPIKTVLANQTELKDKLLQIKGIKITLAKVRSYNLGEAAAQLTGYVQTITKEELEKNEGYTSSSLIGKTGLEKQFETRLKGKNGVEIYIEDKDGNRKKTLIKQDKVDGEDIKLTIDSDLQQNLYDKLKNDEGSFVVMNPMSGEILALVSTPSYDVNKMVLGVTQDEWNEISNNEKTPMLARYLQKYCPGSTFKPITGAIGLTTNSLTKDDTFNYSGLSWQKDSSWGTYNITTLTAYNGAKNLKNALIHSDNIYFAQSALKIGSQNITSGLDKIKFNENIDFELNLAKSQYSNDGKIEKETLLADTGYGQGQILVNPVHMASIYSAFYNGGNMVKPYLEYKEKTEPEYLVQNAFSKEASDEIKNDLIQVVEDPEGTAKDMKINGMTIAGKTGTAELKVSKEEKADTIGWFDCFTVTNENPYLVIGMVEKANQNGGSHYLIPMIKKIFIK